MFLNEFECGFSYPEKEGILDKVMWADTLKFREYLSLYGNVYIIDDYHNFYKQYLSSIIGMKGDTITVYGKSITDRFNTVITPGLNGLNMINKENRPTRLLILGGDPTVDKFFMIQSCLG